MAKEVKTVADMKVGDKILLGQFRAFWDAPPNRDEHTISWIKATKANDFISEHILTFAEYSCREVDGNGDLRYTRDFQSSNLGGFLNSEDQDWFRPAYDGNIRNAYSVMGRHAGFLHYFDDYELDALVVTGETGHGYPIRIRLPHSREVDKWSGGLGMFELFKRKGVRAHPTLDCARYHRIADTSYPKFWTRTGAWQSSRMTCIGSDTYRCDEFVASNIGLRPVCTIKDDVRITNVAGNTYEIDVSNNIYVPSDEELFGMLGLL